MFVFLFGSLYFSFNDIFCKQIDTTIRNSIDLIFLLLCTMAGFEPGSSVPDVYICDATAPEASFLKLA
jgi:hypothetical protein